jgi:hypothetical protein
VSSVTVALATPEDMDDVKRLCQQMGYGLPYNDIDWEGSFPYWIVARINEDIVGCLQVVPSRPMGYAEFMALDEALEPMPKARVFKALETQARAVMQLCGSSMMGCMVTFPFKNFKKLLKRRGYDVVASGNMLATRI